MNKTKVCSYCNIDKPYSDYHMRANKTHPHSRCKTCSSLISKQWRKDNKDRVRLNRISNPSGQKEYKRDKSYKRLYGISLEQYNQLFVEQSGRCAICNIHQSELNKALVVDHNHSTSIVRGLLCSKCNTAIGLLQDNSDIINKASIYVKCKG